MKPTDSLLFVDFDEQDYKSLLTAIYNQSVSDYIKLQHPSQRNKGYLQEAFLDAVDMFFDPSFLFLCVRTEDDYPLNIEEFITLISGTSKFDILKLQDFLSQEAISYWANKDMKFINIPTQIIVHGLTYDLLHHDQEPYKVVYDEYKIFINKLTSKDKQQRDMISAVMELTAYHEGGKYPLKSLRALADEWYMVLKVNDCFVGSS